MNRLLGLFVAVTALVSHCSADCATGDVVDVCVCAVDNNNELTLQCSAVTDGAQITAVLDQIQMAEVSTIVISDSPHLKSMPRGAFGTTAIKSLRFYYTGLQSLSGAVFSGPVSSSLVSLYVKHCVDFTAFDTDMVSSLTSLQSLYLASNSLTELTGALPATALRYIDFSFNNIQQIPSNYFTSASELSVVLLGFNSLTSESVAGQQSFSSSSQDLYLDLGHNDISDGLLALTFTDAAPRELILSDNGIGVLHQEAFGDLMMQMADQYDKPYILMDNNPLSCGCEAEWILDHPHRLVIKGAVCGDGQLLSNLGPGDFSDCP